MKKSLILILFFTLATLWPATSQAISQTTTFTLSVTIPERAGTSASIPVSVSSDEPQTLKPASSVQVDEAVRENQAVFLESYVTK